MSSSIIKLPQDSKLVRLTSDHIIKPFSCGEEKLEAFLFNNAKKYQENLLSVTNILETSNKTIAYYSVSNDLLRIDPNVSRDFKSILKKSIDSPLVYDILSWNSFPAVKLDLFAVDEEFQCAGIGSELMKFIIYNFINNNKTGCLFITAEAINNDRTISFYQKNKFQFFSESDSHAESRSMYRILK